MSRNNQHNIWDFNTDHPILFQLESHLIPERMDENKLGILRAEKGCHFGMYHNVIFSKSNLLLTSGVILR